jgi:hypothetical protein
MTRRDLCVVVALALLATGAALFPTVAGARPAGHYFLRARRVIRFRVHGSHGYVIGVAEGSRGHFAVTVRRGPATTEYELRTSQPQPEPKSKVHWKLGELGTFDAHFTPRGRPRQFSRYPSCTGPGPTIQPGTVRGEIRFRGERGYTRAVAHFARAELETVPGQRCHFGETGHSKHPPRYTATFSADHEPEEGPESHFEALRFAPDSRPPARRVFYEAADYERLGSVLVTREIQLAAETSTFLLPNFAAAPETAVIRPPAPFTGSATLARAAESTFSWTGDLAVSFPGMEPVPFAGPNFRLHYCALRSCIDQESPEEREEFPR